jgi:hypothetical protein
MSLLADGIVHSRALSELLNGLHLPNNSFCVPLFYIDRIQVQLKNSNPSLKLSLTLPFPQRYFTKCALHLRLKSLERREKGKDA